VAICTKIATRQKTKEEEEEEEEEEDGAGHINTCGDGGKRCPIHDFIF